MSIIPHHTSGPVCDLCEDKLTQADPTLAGWFHWAKSSHPDLHVSWSNRDQASQESAFIAGTTKLHFPNSAHNSLPSKALDVFQINDQGQAIWDRSFLSALNDETKAAGYTLRWGGQWPTLGDSDHWEREPPSSSA